jgi:hypothetical protein
MLAILRTGFSFFGLRAAVIAPLVLSSLAAGCQPAPEPARPPRDQLAQAAATPTSVNPTRATPAPAIPTPATATPTSASVSASARPGTPPPDAPAAAPPPSRYKRLAFDEVIVYEFFMPLTNEPQLRSALDALFYKDTIVAKLRAIGVPRLQQHFAVRDNEDPEAYLERLCAWIDDHFVGYSIYHVDGRFRGHRLVAQEDVAGISKQGERYLLDETTAVTRFIFPCDDNAEAELVRFFVDTLFAERIVELTKAEDEIWMVESGMKNRVHIWRKLRGEATGKAGSAAPATQE